MTGENKREDKARHRRELEPAQLTEIRQVRIKGHRIGLAGLDEAFGEIRSRDFACEEDLAAARLELVAGRD